MGMMVSAIGNSRLNSTKSGRRHASSRNGHATHGGDAASRR
jgi:hypothetical protein